MSCSVARERWAMAWRVLRSAVSLNPTVPARLGGELGHLLDARGMEVTALAVMLPEEVRVLVAVAVGAHGESFLVINFGYKPSSARISVNRCSMASGRFWSRSFSNNSCPPNQTCCGNLWSAKKIRSLAVASGYFSAFPSLLRR